MMLRKMTMILKLLSTKIMGDAFMVICTRCSLSCQGMPRGFSLFIISPPQNLLDMWQQSEFTGTHQNVTKIRTRGSAGGLYLHKDQWSSGRPVFRFGKRYFSQNLSSLKKFSRHKNGRELRVSPGVSTWSVSEPRGHLKPRGEGAEIASASAGLKLCLNIVVLLGPVCFCV